MAESPSAYGQCRRSLASIIAYCVFLTAISAAHSAAAAEREEAKIILLSPPLSATPERSAKARAAHLAETLEVIRRSTANRKSSSLDIHLITPDEKLVAVANKFSFRGRVTVHATQNFGAYSTLDLWIPTLNDEDIVPIFLQDDVELSPHFYDFVRSVREKYAKYGDFAAISLEPRSRDRTDDSEFVPGEDFYLSQHADELRSFSPSVEAWRTFIDYARQDRNHWHSLSASAQHERGYHAGESVVDYKRPRWTLNFSLFMVDFRLFTLYPCPSNGKAVALARYPSTKAMLRKAPEYRSLVRQADTLPDLPAKLTRWDIHGKAVKSLASAFFNESTIDAIVDHGLRHGGRIAFTVVNEPFIAMARSWLCNVDAYDWRPPGIVWVVNDQVAFDDMSSIEGTFTIHLDEMQGGKLSTTYGTTGYWLLMMERTFLMLEILNRGISILNFETDAVWLEDPAPHFERYIDEGSDFVGTMNTNREISGNFFYMKSSLNMRRTWRAVCERFLGSYQAKKASKRSPTTTFHISNDQTLITYFILREPKGDFMRRYPVHFQTLDPMTFVDGRWYDRNISASYRSNLADHPVVINNNFIKGIDAKVARAKQFGHWFWNEQARTCLNDAVAQAVRGHAS